jgi:hypothetical protein
VKYPVNPSRDRPRQQQTVISQPYPAPTGGINAISGLAEPMFQDAIYAFNMVPSQYGMKVRDGYTEWCTNVGDGGVRTVIPYKSTSVGEDKLFAAAEDGIYDVTATSTSPSSVLTFGSADATSGYGQYVNFINVGGDKFILYCDETNGYHLYTQSTDTWAAVAAGAAAGQINGADPGNFCFCMIWKKRVWFVERNTGNAYYLPVGQVTGTVTKFNFSNKFKQGGYLVGLWNWTVDGGEGVDDYLVAISSAGDVVVYKGTDPASANTFDQRGVYFIGPTPAGRRVAGAFGGELYLLSSYGLVPISKLMSGQVIIDTSIYVSRKITPLINTEMASKRLELGWEVKLLPSQNLLMISSPKGANESYIQFVQSLDTRGWAIYRDFPYETGDSWNGAFFLGTTDNRILIHTGTLDNVTIASPGEGEAIEFSILTWYQDLGTPAQSKVTQLIRPTFVADKLPIYAVLARYDYDLQEAVAVPISTAPTGSVWDVAIWDSAVWGAGLVAFNGLSGASGMGRSVAIALRGTCQARTTLVRFDLAYTAGNIL